MNIDFHTHANLSKKIKTSIEGLEEKMKEAKASGLTALAITEHFNATNIFELYDMLQETYPYEKDYYKIDEMKVFCGIEVDVKEKGHFLVIDRKSTRLNSSHVAISYAVFCLKKKINYTFWRDVFVYVKMCKVSFQSIR